MIAPNGQEIQGTFEKVSGAAGVVFDPTEPSGYDHSGGTEMFWDESKTQEIQGVPLFLDESGRDWCQHHLIPEGSEPLSQMTINAFKVEMLFGEALDAAVQLKERMESLPKGDRALAYINANDAIAILEPRYEELKAASIAARDAELAFQA